MLKGFVTKDEVIFCTTTNKINFRRHSELSGKIKKIVNIPSCTCLISVANATSWGIFVHSINFVA